MVSLNEVLESLRESKDPETGASIVDMGLIYGIKINGNDVKITMTMTSPMCPVTSIILADVQLRLQKLPGIGKVDIELSWDPLWNPEMMSESLKSMYGL